MLPYGIQSNPVTNRLITNSTTKPAAPNPAATCGVQEQSDHELPPHRLPNRRCELNWSRESLPTRVIVRMEHLPVQASSFAGARTSSRHLGQGPSRNSRQTCGQSSCTHAKHACRSHRFAMHYPRACLRVLMHLRSPRIRHTAHNNNARKIFQTRRRWSKGRRVFNRIGTQLVPPRRLRFMLVQPRRF